MLSWQEVSHLKLHSRNHPVQRNMYTAQSTTLLHNHLTSSLFPPSTPPNILHPTSSSSTTAPTYPQSAVLSSSPQNGTNPTAIGGALSSSLNCCLRRLWYRARLSQSAQRSSERRSPALTRSARPYVAAWQCRSKSGLPVRWAALWNSQTRDVPSSSSTGYWHW
jgi:hypothetical protein